jgi:hypothetical protein
MSIPSSGAGNVVDVGYPILRGKYAGAMLPDLATDELGDLLREHGGWRGLEYAVGIELRRRYRGGKRD